MNGIRKYIIESHLINEADMVYPGVFGTLMTALKKTKHKSTTEMKHNFLITMWSYVGGALLGAFSFVIGANIPISILVAILSKIVLKGFGYFIKVLFKVFNNSYKLKIILEQIESAYLDNDGPEIRRLSVELGKAIHALPAKDKKEIVKNIIKESNIVKAQKLIKDM